MSIYAPQTQVAKARRARTGRVVALAIALVVAAIVGPQAFASSGAGEAAPVDTYTVASGETLWAIAAGLTAEGGDVRDTVAAIQQLNAMSGSSLQAGEQIFVPLEG